MYVCVDVLLLLFVCDACVGVFLHEAKNIAAVEHKSMADVRMFVCSLQPRRIIENRSNSLSKLNQQISSRPFARCNS